MRHTMQVTNEKGTTLNVRLVREGERYGQGDCLVHDNTEALVEFFDPRSDDSELGCFISRYFVSTLANPQRDGQGVLLDTGKPDWEISGENKEAVCTWAATILADAPCAPSAKRSNRP